MILMRGVRTVRSVQWLNGHCAGQLQPAADRSTATIVARAAGARWMRSTGCTHLFMRVAPSPLWSYVRMRTGSSPPCGRPAWQCDSVHVGLRR